MKSILFFACIIITVASCTKAKNDLPATPVTQMQHTVQYHLTTQGRDSFNVYYYDAQGKLSAMQQAGNIKISLAPTAFPFMADFGINNVYLADTNSYNLYITIDNKDTVVRLTNITGAFHHCVVYSVTDKNFAGN